MLLPLSVKLGKLTIFGVIAKCKTTLFAHRSEGDGEAAGGIRQLILRQRQGAPGV